MLVKNSQNGGLEGLENNNNNELNSLVKEYMKSSTNIFLLTNHTNFAEN